MRTLSAYPTLERPPLAKQRVKSLAKPGFVIEAFVIIQIACQLLLLSESVGSARSLVRGAAFGSSLLMLLLGSRVHNRAHPSTNLAYGVVAILVLSLLHPTTNSLMSGAAQIALTTAIIAPLFWVARVLVDFKTLHRVLVLFFVYYSASAAFGVLQAYYPGQFQPSVSSVITDQKFGVEALKITLANGQRILRPMGLTDAPGGAAMAGLYVVILGLGFALTTRQRKWQVLSVGAMILGLICLYLCQVRALLVTTAICLLIFIGLLVWQRRAVELTKLTIALILVMIIGTTFAITIGGKGATDRLATLIEDDPSTVYYKNRGHFLETTIYDLLPQYPLGAGLGRYGMMNYYFGDNSDPDRSSIWVEIQWTGWLLDGGLPLILVYFSAIVLALLAALRVMVNIKGGDLSIWGGIILAYNVGGLAATFSYPLFLSQSGLQFWLLNAVLFSVAARTHPDVDFSKAIRD